MGSWRMVLTLLRLHHARGELEAISNEKYGSKIVSTVSRQLTERYGKGYQRNGGFIDTYRREFRQMGE